MKRKQRGNRFTFNQLAVLVTLALLVCITSVAGGLLVWKSGFTIAAAPPIVVTVVVSPTSTLQVPATTTPAGSPTVTNTPKPTATRRPAINEKDVRAKICKYLQKNASRDSNGDYAIRQSNDTVLVQISYMYLGYSSCDDNTFKLGVVADNVSNYSVHVNPLYFYVIDFNNQIYGVDSSTFGASSYLEAINLQPNTYTFGWLYFALFQETPQYIIYDDGFNPAIKIDLKFELFR